MDLLIQDLGRATLIGIGATALMDLWLALLARLGVPTLDFAMIGRWVGHWRHGVFFHAAIRDAAPVNGERALGWITHYATGVGFAVVLVAATGAAWIREPTWWPALGLGVATVAAPWLLVQPAMGAGVASARTRTPGLNRARNLCNHAVFGLGLYFCALLLARISR